MYATKADILKIHTESNLIALTNSDDDDFESIKDDRLDAAIEMASSKINGFIAERYDLPISHPSKLLTSFCIDITIYELATGGDRLTDDITRRRDDAFSYLKLVAQNKASLGLPAKQAEKAQATTIIVTDPPDRQFKGGIL